MEVLRYKGPVNFVAYPSYPACRANFSYIFLQNVVDRLQVSLASRMTRLNCASPFLDGRVPVTIGISAFPMVGSPFKPGKLFSI